MRFALISNNAFSLVNFRGRLIGDIANRGHTVLALAPDFTPEIRRDLRKWGAEPIDIAMSRTGLNPIRDSIDALQLARTLSSLRLDAVLSYGIKPVIYGTMAARLAGIPNRFALIAGLGFAFGPGKAADLKGRVVHRVAKALYRIALGQAHAVFMQNPDDVSEFDRLKIVKQAKMVLVNGTGVDLMEWPVLPPPGGPVTFLMAARLLAEKGIHNYVEAARLVKGHAPESRFLLLGGLDTNPSGIRKSQVEEWAAEGIVEWPGHVDIRPYLARASLFVLPSYYREGIPRSIQEAMASGRAIITTDAPGCRETVIEGYNGFLVRPRDAHGLAEAMLKFIDAPAIVTEMGRHSRLLAEKRFDVKQINGKMIARMGL